MLCTIIKTVLSNEQYAFHLNLNFYRIKANHDLKHKIDSVVKWTTEETQDREKERKDHEKALNDKDKIM